MSPMKQPFGSDGGKMVEYEVNQEPIVLSKGLIDLLLKQDKPSDLIALYTFYYYTAKWQKTNQPKSTTSYTSKGLNWTEEKVQKNKKILKQLGLVEDLRRTDDQGKVTGHYIKVNFIWSHRKNQTLEKQGGGEKTTPRKNHPLVGPGINALSNNIRNALNNNNIISDDDSNVSPSHDFNETIPSRKRERTLPIPEVPSQDVPIRRREPSEAFIIGARIMKAVPHGLWELMKIIRQSELPSGQSYWFQQCTLVGQMVNVQGIQENRIKELVSWLWAHHSDEYVPKFFEAIEFKNKFFKLEEAKKRQSQPRNNGYKGPGGAQHPAEIYGGKGTTYHNGVRV
jgi:hypothetical protein